MAQVKIPLTLTLQEAQFKKIADQVEGTGEDAQKFAFFTQEAIRAIAKGAMLLQPDVAQRLTDMSENLGDPEELVSMVERGMGMREGNLVARWQIDQSLYAPLKERAEIQGVTPEILVQEMMDQAVAMNWFYDLDAKVKTLFFSPEDYAKLCDAMGEKDVTGAMLLSRLVIAEEVAAQPEQGSDPANPESLDGSAGKEDQDELAFITE